MEKSKISSTSFPPSSSQNPWQHLRGLMGPLFRWGILVAVLVGVGHRIWAEKEKLAVYELWLSPKWLLVSGVCYLAGLIPCALFWRQAMHDQGGRPQLLRTLSAYYAGHLGKYVPGKGLVLIIRATMLSGQGVSAATAAITCVHETLLMMATGSLVSLILLLRLEMPHRNYLLAGSILLAAVFGVFAIPPVSGRLGRLALKAVPNSSEYETGSCRWQSVGWGLLMIAAGWCLMGVSLAAVLTAMHEWTEIVNRLGVLKTSAILTVDVALATVGGFVSMTPGGLGAREWILVETLGPVIGGSRAVVASVILRLVWIAGEALTAGIFWIADGQWNRHKVQPS
jgi:uncharacterized membrane protein YbhN (UPF0104 family)